jgi:DNA-binding IclR family transcriptional regulator
MVQDDSPLNLVILHVLTEAPEPLTAADIVRRTGASRATVDRALQRLTTSGWVVEHGPPKRYAASMRVARMGAVLLARSRTLEVALRYARDLADAVQCPTLVAFYVDGDTFYTDLVEVRTERFVHSIRGMPSPAFRTAAGRILLSHQPEQEIQRVLSHPIPLLTPYGLTDREAIASELQVCRDRGYALVENEVQVGRGGIAVPILGRNNEAAAALSLALPTPLEEPLVNRLVSTVRFMALQASMELQDRAVGGNWLA